MALKIGNPNNIRLLQQKCIGLLVPVTNSVNTQIVRHRQTKHWDPRWKVYRRLKVQKVDLPNFQEDTKKLSDDELRNRLKKQDMLPQPPWTETNWFLHSTGGIFEPYVPPEGDGKVSPISKQGAMQSLAFLNKKRKTMMAIRKIRQYEEEFDSPQFCKDATQLYIKMHELLAAKDEDNIIDVITERAFPEVMHNTKNKTIRWKYLKDIELPRIVQARSTHVITQENMFAQVTVRFHTQQILAVYDRFGRLMHGSEILAKDVLEYVVFEKHLSNEYGAWRIHAKIIPDWLPPREPAAMTFIKDSVDATSDTALEVAEPVSDQVATTEKPVAQVP